jgi:uncharacterized protein YjbJ (UPF0337 family)
VTPCREPSRNGLARRVPDGALGWHEGCSSLSSDARQGCLFKENDSMNWDQIKGEWKEAKGKLRSKWAKLTDDDLENIAGKKDVLVGRLQQRYGWKKEQAEKDVDDYLKTV